MRWGMDMNNALVLTTIDETYRMAKGLIMSGLLPKSIKTAEQAFAIITLGAELGFAAWQSMNSIDVIQGKPTLKPQAMLALIHRSGLAEMVKIPNVDEIAKANAATVTMTRKGGMTHTETFTWAMAELMETTEYVDNQKRTIPMAQKYNWRTMPEIMMKWRAVSACARVVFPDVIMGMYTADEIDADSVRVSDAIYPPDNSFALEAENAPKPKNGKSEFFKHLEQAEYEMAIEMGDPDYYKADGEPEPTDTPLSADDATQLTKWAKSQYKMSYQALCEALGIDNLPHYTGSYDDAVDAVNAARKAVTA